MVREWDVGFGGFRGGALPDEDRGLGVTVRMSAGGGWSPAMWILGDFQSRAPSLPGSAPESLGRRMPVSISTYHKNKNVKPRQVAKGFTYIITFNPHNSFMRLETLIST